MTLQRIKWLNFTQLDARLALLFDGANDEATIAQKYMQMHEATQTQTQSQTATANTNTQVTAQTNAQTNAQTTEQTITHAQATEQVQMIKSQLEQADFIEKI